MASIIQIKRSTGASAPSTSVLAEGELAYTQDKSNNGANAILYIESILNNDSPVIHKVGGKFYTDLIDQATDVDTANAIVRRDSLASLSANVVTANVINAVTLSGNITGNVTGVAASAAKLETGRVINLAGDLEGNVLFDGTQDVTIYANVFANGVALGTDTTGDYVANLLPSTGMVVTGYAGETSTLTVALENTAVTPTTYGGITNIPVLDIDQQGRITNAANVSISTTLELSANTGTDSLSLADETLSIRGGYGITTDVTSNSFSIINLGVTTLATSGHGIVFDTANGDVTATFTGVGAVSGTANEIEVSGSTGNVQIGLPSDVTIGNDLIVTNDATISGNLYVSGTAFTVNSDTLSINDPLLHLANNNTTSDVVDIGFEGHYYDSTFGDRHAGIFRDADDGGKFKFFANVSVELENQVTVDTTGNGFSIANVVLNLVDGSISNLLSAINVSDGGTGRQTLTANAVLYGDGTNQVALATGSAGQVLQLNDDGMVVFGVIDGGSY